MAQNLLLKRLPDDVFRIVDGLASKNGIVRFLDPSKHIAFDIFDEENDQPVADCAPWDSSLDG